MTVSSTSVSTPSVSPAGVGSSAVSPGGPVVFSTPSKGAPGGPGRGPWWTLVVRGLVALLLVVMGAGVFVGLRSTAPTLDASDAERARTRVLVFEPRPVVVRRPWRGYGTARALDATNVPARLTATVLSVPLGVLDGAAVSAGDVLATLDASDFVAEVDRLEAGLAEVEALLSQLDAQERRLLERVAFEEEELSIAVGEFDRVGRLSERNVATDQDVDRARSAVLSAERGLTLTRETLDGLPARRAGLAAQRMGLEAQLRLAGENVARATVVSPMDGVLEEVMVEPGESVSPGMSVARVVDPRVMEVPVRLPAGAVGRVKPGDAVVLSPTNDPGRRFEAEVSRVSPAVEAQTRTVTVYALLDQTGLSPGQRLVPGTFVEAGVLTGEATARLVVPRRSLRRGRVQAVVAGADGGEVIESLALEPLFTLRASLPSTGLADEEWAVLADDALPAGTRILLTGSSTLLDGQAVLGVEGGGDREDREDREEQGDRETQETQGPSAAEVEVAL